MIFEETQMDIEEAEEQMAGLKESLRNSVMKFD
jgi:hypothetical protein